MLAVRAAASSGLSPPHVAAQTSKVEAKGNAFGSDAEDAVGRHFTAGLEACGVEEYAALHRSFYGLYSTIAQVRAAIGCAALW